MSSSMEPSDMLDSLEAVEAVEASEASEASMASTGGEGGLEVGRGGTERSMVRASSALGDRSSCLFETEEMEMGMGGVSRKYSFVTIGDAVNGSSSSPYDMSEKEAVNRSLRSYPRVYAFGIDFSSQRSGIGGGVVGLTCPLPVSLRKRES